VSTSPINTPEQPPGAIATQVEQGEKYQHGLIFDFIKPLGIGLPVEFLLL
jgi:hypothetical protein